MTLKQTRDGGAGAVQRISSWPVSCLRRRLGTGRGRACSGGVTLQLLLFLLRWMRVHVQKGP
ncbi:unnamed protein product [Spirodela intermedia]|uniref:Uncharacterized protein n=1 Tax=Spirodela intermedia TaxID=51605 RepID=A0A7I8JTF7_SPIIN|nr:unnamed protein product [Spirodela intermedia]CAA6672903.1 unnamed protein product [Spirodela intermedia]